MYDKIEAIISDTAYGVSWDGDTTTAPSKNAVYDKLELIAADYVPDTGNTSIAGVKTFGSDPIIPDEVYSASWNGSLEPPTKNAVYDKIQLVIDDIPLINNTIYTSVWNGDTTAAPSRNAVYDKLELMVADIDLRATIASPELTGTPTAPTAAAGTTNTQIATTAFVRTPSVQSVVSAATVTPTALNDVLIITAQAEALFIQNIGGTVLEGQELTVRIKDNGTGRAISWGGAYRAVGIALPTTTVATKTMYLKFIRNVADNAFDLILKTEGP
jgi:hypothetical protein